MVHAWIHIGRNRLRHRIRAYAASWAVLLALWICVVVAVDAPAERETIRLRVNGGKSSCGYRYSQLPRPGAHLAGCNPAEDTPPADPRAGVGSAARSPEPATPAAGTGQYARWGQNDRAQLDVPCAGQRARLDGGSRARRPAVDACRGRLRRDPVRDRERIEDQTGWSGTAADGTQVALRFERGRNASTT